jgi:TPR repeat protein
MYRLGMAYMNGELGLASNPKDGVKWFSRSVEAVTPEYPEALHELAALHEQGIPNVVFIDLAYAAQLYEQAANLEYAPSAFRMGECYEYGKLNCQRDPALSIHYYTIAAENKHREACFALTAWYLVGSPNILQQSDENAYIWARRAAELELPKAEYAVGYFTETGIGCAKDPEQSLAWYNKAAEHGDKRAIQRLQGKVPQTQKNSPGRKSIQDDCKIM